MLRFCRGQRTSQIMIGTRAPTTVSVLRSARAGWAQCIERRTLYGQLGEREAARNALRELLVLRPDFATMARQEAAKLWWDSELVEHLIDGLRKARLDITG